MWLSMAVLFSAAIHCGFVAFLGDLFRNRLKRTKNPNFSMAVDRNYFVDG
jgi:hypothetical protein